MPTKGQVHIDKALTNMSLAFMQDPNNYIAAKVFPVVPVVKQSDRYFKYLKEDWFRDDAQKRAMGTESAGGDYTIDNTPTYFCEKYAFHKDVFEEDRVNSDAPLQPDQDATDFVTDKLLLRREMAWAGAYFKSGVWERDIVGDAGASDLNLKKATFWDDPASTPIQDITYEASQMGQTTGKRPNKLVIGQRVFDALKNHPDVLDRIKFTQRGIVTEDLLASLFDVEQVLVARAIKNVANKGAAANMQYIYGNNALLTYTEARPGIKKACAGYIFAWTGLEGSNAFGGRVSRIPAPLLGAGTERIEGEMAFDIRVVAKDLGTMFNNIVQP